ncbi:SHOCT domain-containing protein [bacterium]|nr:SHOCT domain-containing protein [bacterium]
MMNGMAIWTIALFGLVMVGLLIWLIVNSATSHYSSSLENDFNDALEILRRRLARGEIRAQEFEEKRKFLEKSFAQEK